MVKSRRRNTVWVLLKEWDFWRECCHVAGGEKKNSRQPTTFSLNILEVVPGMKQLWEICDWKSSKKHCAIKEAIINIIILLTLIMKYPVTTLKALQYKPGWKGLQMHFLTICHVIPYPRWSTPVTRGSKWSFGVGDALIGNIQHSYCFLKINFFFWLLVFSLTCLLAFLVSCTSSLFPPQVI